MRYYLSKNDDPRLLELNALGYPIKTILLSILNMKSDKFNEYRFNGDDSLLDTAHLDIPLDSKLLASDVVEMIKNAGDEKEQAALIRELLNEHVSAFFEGSNDEEIEEADEIEEVSAPVEVKEEPKQEEKAEVAMPETSITEEFEIPFLLKKELGIIHGSEENENFVFPGITDADLYTIPYQVSVSENEVKGAFLTYTSEASEEAKEKKFTVCDILGALEQEEGPLDEVLGDDNLFDQMVTQEETDEADTKNEEEILDYVNETANMETEEVEADVEENNDSEEEQPIEETEEVQEEVVEEVPEEDVADEVETDVSEAEQEVSEDEIEEIPEDDVAPEDEIEEAPIEEEIEEMPEDDVDPIEEQPEEAPVDDASEIELEDDKEEELEPTEISDEAKKAVNVFVNMVNKHI